MVVDSGAAREPVVVPDVLGLLVREAQLRAEVFSWPRVTLMDHRWWP